MQDKTTDTGATIMAGYTGFVKVCQDRRLLPDWCSREEIHGL